MPRDGSRLNHRAGQVRTRKESGNGSGRGWPETNGESQRRQVINSFFTGYSPHAAAQRRSGAGRARFDAHLAARNHRGSVEKINENYFYVPAHQTIYTVLVELWNAGQGIDLITFTQVLRDRNVLDTVGGAAFVTSLFTFVPTAANVDLLPRDRPRQIHPPPNHQRLHRKRAPLASRSRTKSTICSTKWSRRSSPSAKIASKDRC